MRRADLLTAALLCGLGLLVTAEGWRLGIGWSTDGPQSGFFVFYLGLALGLSSLVVLTRTALSAGAGVHGKAFVERAQLVPVAKVLVPATLMVLATHFVGLYVAGALYVAVYMRWIGRHRWITTALVSMAIPLVSFLIFEVWFLVPMPKGPIETYLGY